MGLQVVNAVRRHVRGAVGRHHGCFHAVVMGGGQRCALPAVTHAAALDLQVDAVAVPLGIGQRLEQQDANPFGAHIAIGLCLERAGLVLSAEKIHQPIAGRFIRRQQQVDSTNQRLAAFAGTDRLHGPVQRHRHGRAGRVAILARSAQIQEVGDPVRVHAGRGRRQQERVVLGRLDHLAIFARGGGDEDPGAAAGKPRGRHPGVFECQPGMLQQQPLLGIHQRRFLGRHAEERVVETIDIVEVATRKRRVGSPGRCLADLAGAAADSRPEILQLAAGEATADPDDRKVVTRCAARGWRMCGGLRGPGDRLGLRLAIVRR